MSLDITIEHKAYSTKKNIIQDFKLNIKAQEFICLVGPSGCGKTTLLNILAGLDTDFTGDILLKKNTKPPKIGYIFQTPRLLPWRTVAENIYLTTHCDTKTLNFLLANMGLSAEKNSYPAHLSLGMNRRVSIIRAFANNPNLLLMDEPFVSLDPPTARQVRSLLVQLWQQRPHKVLFVTHNLHEAIQLADRLIFLNSHPMSVMKEVFINIPRDQRYEEDKIECFRQQLFIDYPEITTLL